MFNYYTLKYKYLSFIALEFCILLRKAYALQSYF